jgi:hypothetical protein
VVGTLVGEGVVVVVGIREGGIVGIGVGIASVVVHVVETLTRANKISDTSL